MSKNITQQSADLYICLEISDAYKHGTKSASQLNSVATTLGRFDVKSLRAPLSVAFLLLVSLSRVDAAFIEVKPIQICDDAGANCADNGFFEAETDKIWAQAGIDVRFLSTTQISKTAWLQVDYGNPLPQEPKDMMVYARDNINDSDSTLAINMFFVDTMPGLYGLGCGAPIYSTFCDGLVGVFITGDIYTFNSGVGRLDTIAHELGHVLGLTHEDWGAGAANNLMTTGGSRTVPGSIGDIFPDGASLSRLSDEQITEVYKSKFVQVPEPGTLALMALVLVSATVARRYSRHPACRESSPT